MATTRIKEKLSTLVANQLPEHIRSEYTTFVTFLEAYYQYLEQDQYAHELIQNARSYADIDRTIDSFIEYFIKEYCSNIPRELSTDKRFLIKQIKDLYNSKGSEKSFDLLFQLLFNKKPEYLYPSTQVLRASDGKWVQQVTVFLQTIKGDPDTVIGKYGTVISGVNRSQVYLSSKRDVISIVPGSGSDDLVTRDDVFEFTIDNSKNVSINVGDVVEVGGYRGRVQGVPVSIDVVSSGLGFKVGQIFNLTSGDGRGSRIKILKVTSSGAIQNAQLITYGLNYNQDFYAYVSSIDAEAPRPSFDFGAGNVTLTDNLTGFVDYGFINFSNYAVDAFEGSYAGTILRQFYSDSGQLSGNSTATGQDALLLVRVGAKARYPGYYKNNDGFISDAIYLEDADYFQPFSYVLRIDEQLSTYKKAVQDLLHPAGTKLFGDYLLSDTFDIIPEITTTLRFLTSNFFDDTDITETNTKVFTKNSSDILEILESTAKTLTKGTFDFTANTEDTVTLTFTPNISDSITPVSDSTSYTFSGNVYEYYAYELYFSEDYSQTIDEVVVSDVINITVNP